MKAVSVAIACGVKFDKGKSPTNSDRAFGVERIC